MRKAPAPLPETPNQSSTWSVNAVPRKVTAADATSSTPIDTANSRSYTRISHAASLACLVSAIERTDIRRLPTALTSAQISAITETTPATMLPTGSVGAVETSIIASSPVPTSPGTS